MNTIKVKIEKESDLYNPFDMEKKTLSSDVKSYIMEKIHAGKRARDLEIQVIADNEVDQERTKQAIDEWINEEEINMKKAYQSNLLQMLVMFGVGVMFIALSLILQSKVHVVWFTVLSTIGAFSMWEAAGIWIIRNPKIRGQRFLMKMLRKHLSIRVIGPGN